MALEDTERGRLLLAGGGHAHLFVLERLARDGARFGRVQLVSPSRWQYYSGMLPGWLAGHYTLEQCRLDLVALCRAAGVEFIEQPVVALNADSRQVRLGDGRVIGYDQLSLDIGSETGLGWARGFDNSLLAIKPLELFQSRWRAMLETFGRRQSGNLAVVGGGAAGVELAMAAAHALAQHNLTVNVTLVAGNDGPLPGHSAATRKRICRELSRCGVGVIQGRGEAYADNLFADGRTLPADAIIAATGAQAPAWLADTGLALSDNGFVLVDACHRSPSHPEVFAVGDICARPGTALSRSGVHSVKAGPVLAHNLMAAPTGGHLQRYRPRKRSLYLISCGSRRAVALWGGLSLAADWIWYGKDRIDRRFMARFAAD